MSSSIREVLFSGAWHDQTAWLPNHPDALAAESLGFRRAA